MLAVDVHAHFFPPAAHEELISSALEDKGGGLSAAAEGFSPLSDLDARLAWMSQRQIALQILGPELRFARYDLRTTPGARWARRLNELTVEASRPYSVFAVLATLPMQDGQQAAIELHRAVEALGCRGAMVHSQTPFPLHHRGYDFLWAEAARLRVPVVIHSGPPIRDPRMDDLGLASIVGRPHEVGIAASQLIVGRVLERHPTLRLILLMGGGTLPYLLPRLVAHGHPEAAMSLRRLYFDDAVYGTEQLAMLLDLAGMDRIMLGSDWPFAPHDHDPVAALGRLGLDVADQDRLLARNAVEVFGLPSSVC